MGIASAGTGIKQFLGSTGPSEFALGVWMLVTACLTTVRLDGIRRGTAWERLAPQSLRLCCALVKRGVMRAFARAVARLTRSTRSPSE